MSNFFKCVTVCLLMMVMITACVPNKRLVYFQAAREPKVDEVKNDDGMKRIYNTHFQEYKLRPKDIISLRVASITPSEYDFIQKYEEQLGLIRSLNQYDLVNKSGSTRQRSGIATGGDDGVMPAISLDRQQTGFVLDDAGILELPYIGAINFAGLSISQAEDTVKSRLKGYFETPVVRIQLMNFHFTILGEVNKEGRYTVFNPNSTVVDAISIAENLTDFADRSKIKIIRTTQGGKAEVFYVNTLKEDLLGQPGYYLQPDDILIVPPLPARSSRKYTLPTYTTAVSLITSTLTLVLFLVSNNR